MSTATAAIPKPVLFTIIAVLIAIPMQPIPGIDALYDLVMPLFVGYRWFRYVRATKEIHAAVSLAGAQRRGANSQGAPPPSDYEAGVRAFEAKQWKSAHAFFEKAGASGNARAMTYLGLLLMKEDVNVVGKPIDGRYVMAEEWFRKAMNAGDKDHAPVGLNALGYRYDNGTGVAKSAVKAHACYCASASGAYPPGMYNAALNFAGGCGTEKNVAKAKELFSAVAAMGDREDAKDLAPKALKHLADILAQEQQGQKRSKALEILGLREGATKQEMLASYKRLMQSVHPDKGGSDYFAKQLNEAREVLGF